jgi:hypothetical protein
MAGSCRRGRRCSPQAAAPTARAPATVAVNLLLVAWAGRRAASGRQVRRRSSDAELLRRVALAAGPLAASACYPNRPYTDLRCCTARGGGWRVMGARGGPDQSSAGACACACRSADPAPSGWPARKLRAPTARTVSSMKLVYLSSLRAEWCAQAVRVQARPRTRSVCFSARVPLNSQRHFNTDKHGGWRQLSRRRATGGDAVAVAFATGGQSVATQQCGTVYAWLKHRDSCAQLRRRPTAPTRTLHDAVRHAPSPERALPRGGSASWRKLPHATRTATDEDRRARVRSEQPRLESIHIRGPGMYAPQVPRDCSRTPTARASCGP